MPNLESDDRAGFAVAADAYDRFMGRYSTLLAPAFADFAGVDPGLTALDVGCGTGALTSELVRRIGEIRVGAVDPSASFVAAIEDRFPDVEVHLADAANLPYEDGTFDQALAQLVVHFMPDPVLGLAEMRRVTKPGGTVAACVWDHAGGSGPLSTFWRAAREINPGIDDESERPGTAAGELEALMAAAGLDQITETGLDVNVDHLTFEEWWDPFLLGVGPAGRFVAGLTPEGQIELRNRCRSLLPEPPFEVVARAWAAKGAV